MQAAATPAKEIRSIAQCMGHLHNCDPKKGNLSTAGLHALGKELQQEFEALPEHEKWLYRCRRCRKEKDGSQMLRVDVSQHFKALSRGKVAVAMRRLGKREKTRWKCAAVRHGRDARGKPNMTLVRRVYRKKESVCGLLVAKQGISRRR